MSDIVERVARWMCDQSPYSADDWRDYTEDAMSLLRAIDLPAQREAAARAALEAAAREAWATRNGSVGMCDCEDCISQNIMHIDPAAFRGYDHATGK